MQAAYLSGNPMTLTRYVLDGNNVVQEIVMTSNNSNPVIAATYLIGPSGPLYKRPANSTDVRWYVYDGCGNVTGEVDPSGNVTASEQHDVYGASRGISGTAISKHGWQGQVGHQSDGETGLVYMRARYYTPELGRFQSEDKSKDGINWFTYCINDPVNKIDESGKEAFDIINYIAELFRRWELGYVEKESAIEYLEGMKKLLGRLMTAQEREAAEGEVRAWLEANAAAYYGEGATLGMEIAQLEHAASTKHLSTAAVHVLAQRMIDVMIEIIRGGMILD